MNPYESPKHVRTRSAWWFAFWGVLFWGCVAIAGLAVYGGVVYVNFYSYERVPDVPLWILLSNLALAVSLLPIAVLAEGSDERKYPREASQ